MAFDQLCPQSENATECLLRELLRLTKVKNDQYNWDPLTFGFTVTIALAAALFALATIILALFSNGGGRRRTNATAIGEWSKYRTWRWSWHEMSFLFTGCVPVLTFRTVESMLSENTTPIPSSTHRNKVVASWVALFQVMGLDAHLHESLLSERDVFGQSLTRLFTEPQLWTQVAADFFPSDIPALPAYCQIGLLVTLAASIGADKATIDPQTQCPLLVGNDFQLEFRQHLVLGIIGAFSIYGAQRFTVARVDGAQLRTHLSHAQGLVTLRRLRSQKTWKFSLRNPSQFNQHLLLELRGPRECPLHTSDVTDICNGSWTLNCGVQKDWWLLLAEAPCIPFAIFPLDFLPTTFLCQMLGLNSDLWSEWRRSPREPNSATFTSSRSMAWQEWLISESGPQKIPHRLTSGDGLLAMFGLAQRYMHDDEDFLEWFRKRPSVDGSRESQRLLRRDVCNTLSILDSYLRRSEIRDIAACKQSALICVTLSLQKVFRQIATIMGKSSMGYSSQPPVPSTDSKTRESVNLLGRRFSILLDSLEMILDPEELPKHKHSSSRNRKLMAGATLDDILPLSLCHENRSQNELSISTLRKQLARIVARRGDPSRTAKSLSDDHLTRDDANHDLGENVQDILIWRWVLIDMLFRTAPDNSELLKSSRWEQVVPVI